MFRNFILVIYSLITWHIVYKIQISKLYRKRKREEGNSKKNIRRIIFKGIAREEYHQIYSF